MVAAGHLLKMSYVIESAGGAVVAVHADEVTRAARVRFHKSFQGCARIAFVVMESSLKATVNSQVQPGLFSKASSKKYREDCCYDVRHFLGVAEHAEVEGVHLHLRIGQQIYDGTMAPV